MKKVDLKDIKWDKMNGLIPVVVQDIDSKDVLMQAFVNEEALRLSIKSGYAHYFSRSRNTIWKKGETSGNVQKIVKILVDCDEDCILYMVKQSGVACHTGEYSCFFREINALE
ncbi:MULTISPECIES: phosphoribosyl-AMP cyclohydrolase [Calditerrivibrio]|uniref:Phosphoribosyl-AMP cyclohydrolase n=1 Tax=Calditerrivibrio nitroreducens TaxID=477976 RepID=A0A2J6WNQ4_9BACT|nr:MAG: phosphoribosyl-AMP cyclohydrolase [Calditerrivibrio nitroreducens]